ncbi:transposase [Paenibacillus psychroresistens]|uniref:Transposase n=1 Tax=Paenibacillus psychroresistens TaxID=1778678 RepID=A0A6B8RM51_9BACL|nr:transposase [Paenibacillus psychroresistens]QGQ93745.1 transposase [Paenibacillus psychroresistens]QGQ96506.1 transposase [Paenibacillus psychroresistens]
MYNIQQESLFSLQDLLEMSPKDTFAYLFETLDINPFLRVVSKKAFLGAPTQLNYVAMLQSLFIRIVERIPTIKDLRKRLKRSIEFSTDCGFMGSDRIPSEASYTRLIQKLLQSEVFQQSQQDLVKQAFHEGFIDASAVAIDATHVEARDRQPEKKKEDSQPLNTKTPTKKRGRKSKGEREQWLKEQLELEENRTLFEKKVETQASYSYDELVKEIPLTPAWGVKKNSEGKNVFWYGFKAHLVVDCKSQYILVALLTSGNMNDGKLAIPLLKGLAEKHPELAISQVIADAGYDLVPIYKQVESMGARALIDYNRRNEHQEDGMDKYFRPVCKEGHSYRYDSFDPKYETVKYTQPKECSTCPFNDGHCQKVFKKKIDDNPRRYTVPARGSDRYREQYKKRTAVERVNAYLKEFFQLNNIRHRGALAKVDFEFACLTYTACKLTADRLNQYIKMKKSTA